MPVNQDQNKQIDEVMNSLQGMQRIPADPMMYEKVMNRLNSQTSKRSNNIRILRPRIAAAAILLLVINVASIFHFTKKQQSQAEQTAIYQAVNDDIRSLADANY